MSSSKKKKRFKCWQFNPQIINTVGDRFVGNEPSVYLSCALAGTHGQADRNYNSAESNFEIGVWKTWYMKDEDNDGREDYCRYVSKLSSGEISL